MFALPSPPPSITPLLLTVAFGLAIAIAFIVIRVVTSREESNSPSNQRAESDARKCRYCRRGSAALREESVRLDGDDLVDVRCYVCSNCGLPQWWIERRGIHPHVH
jgi:hypothetical protein